MKVNVVKSTFCYERYVIFHVYNENGELIDSSFEHLNTHNANNEFRAFASLNDWEFDKIEKF